MTSMPAWLQIVIGLSNAVVLLLLCILMLLAIRAAVALRRLSMDVLQRLDAVSERLRTDFGPVMKDAASLVTDLKSVAMTVHQDAESVHRVVTNTAQRVEDLSDAVQERLERLGTLVDVVQDETENIVVSAVAAAQGVRGMSAIWRRALGSVWPFLSHQERQNGTQHQHPHRHRQQRDEGERPRVRPRSSSAAKHARAPWE